MCKFLPVRSQKAALPFQLQDISFSSLLCGVHKISNRNSSLSIPVPPAARFVNSVKVKPMHMEAGASANLPDNEPCTPCNDPMSARKTQRTYNNSPNQFSTPIRSLAASPGPVRLNTTPSPGHHYNQSHCLDQQMYRAPMPHQLSCSLRGPIGMTSPFPQQHGTPAIWNRPSGTPGYGMPPNSPTVSGFIPNSPTIGGFPSPGFRQVSPRPSPGRGIANQFNNTPSPNFGYQFNSTPIPSFGNQFNNIPNPNFRNQFNNTVGSPNPNSGGSNKSQFSNNPSFGNQMNNNPSPRFGGTPSSNVGESSRSQFGNSPKPSFGQSNPSPNAQRSSVNQVGNNPSPSSGQGHKKRKGTKGPVSARERPDLFYKRSMLEDPWKFLKPVVRQSTSKSWLPESISNEKKKTIPDKPKVNLSGVSFAEFLAAAFEDAAAPAPSPAPGDDDVNNV